MNPAFFKTQIDFRNWLADNFKIETEKLVAYYKIGSGKPSMTWSESVDQALCFGWIDGITKSINEESYCVRFTPRRKNSVWSAKNIKKVEALKKMGLMLPAGIESYENRTENRSAVYAFENDALELRDDLRDKFMANAAAWEFFQKQAPSYKRTCFYSIMTAKQEKTKLTRLERLINASRLGAKL